MVLKRDDAASLADAGLAERTTLQQNLVERARELADNGNAEAAIDELGADGATLGTSYTKGRAYYVLARRSNDGPLFESVYGGEDGDPGFDLVQSGTMRMREVPADSPGAMQGVFDDVLRAIRTTRLTLVDADGRALPKGTVVRFWKRDGTQAAPLGRATPWSDPEARLDTLGEKGQVGGKRFERTWHSRRLLYAVAFAPGDSTLYESTVSNGIEPSFDVIAAGTLTMKPVPKSEKRAAAMRELFVHSSADPIFSDRLYGPWGWVVFSLIGLFFGLLGAWVWRGRQVADLEQRVQAWKQESNHWKQEASKNPDSAARDKEYSSSRLDALRNENSELRKEIENLKAAGRRRHVASQGIVSSPHRAPSPPSPRSEKPSSPKNPDREKAGEVFTEWCKHQDPVMVDRHYLFKRKVESAMSGAAFRRITREKNAAGLVFDDQAEDPVEYWLVESSGQHYLFPQPSRSRFRELGNCFEGDNKAPSRVSSVTPALLKSQGGRLALMEKGKVA
jgi:hypothetical protein